MALSIGFRIFSFLPSCYSSYGVLNFYPDGTFTHCSCQPSLDAHLSFLIRPDFLERFRGVCGAWPVHESPTTRPSAGTQEHCIEGGDRRNGGRQGPIARQPPFRRLSPAAYLS